MDINIKQPQWEVAYLNAILNAQAAAILALQQQPSSGLYIPNAISGTNLLPASVDIGTF